MQKLLSIRGPLALLFVVAPALTACDRPEPAEVPSAPEEASIATAALVDCPTDETRASSATVSLLGGVVNRLGTIVSVPPEALLAPITLDVEIPASQYMLVELGVNGEDHWQFLAPITVTIDYSRCQIGLLDPPVHVWNVDPATGDLLEHMGGVDNRLLRRVTFTTDHFSGYAIAN